MHFPFHSSLSCLYSLLLLSYFVILIFSILHSPILYLNNPFSFCIVHSLLSFLHFLLYSPVCAILISSLFSPFLLSTPFSPLPSLHSLLYTPFSPLSSLHSLLSTLFSTLSSLHSLLSTFFYPLSSLQSLRSILFSPLSSLHSLLSTLFSLLSFLQCLLSTLISPLSSLYSCFYSLHYFFPFLSLSSYFLRLHLNLFLIFSFYSSLPPSLTCLLMCSVNIGTRFPIKGKSSSFRRQDTQLPLATSCRGSTTSSPSKSHTTHFLSLFYYFYFPIFYLPFSNSFGTLQRKQVRHIMLL